MKGIAIVNPSTGDTFKMCRHCWDTVGQLTHRQMQAQDPNIPDLQWEDEEIRECQMCKKNELDIN